MRGQGEEKLNYGWDTFPEWDDFRFKENADVEYIKAVEKWVAGHKAELREMRKLSFSHPKWKGINHRMDLLDRMLG